MVRFSNHEHRHLRLWCHGEPTTPPFRVCTCSARTNPCKKKRCMLAQPHGLVPHAHLQIVLLHDVLDCLASEAQPNKIGALAPAVNWSLCAKGEPDSKPDTTCGLHLWCAPSAGAARSSRSPACDPSGATISSPQPCPIPCDGPPYSPWQCRVMSPPSQALCGGSFSSDRRRCHCWHYRLVGQSHLRHRDAPLAV